MTRWNRIGSAGVALALAAGAAAAQTAALDKAAVLRELEKLVQTHQDRVAAEQKSAGEGLSKALVSQRALLDLYEEAVFATKFEGGKRDNAEFKKWKNAQDDTLKDNDFQAALELHASYLQLTFQRATGLAENKVIEALAQHVTKVWAYEQKYDLRKRSTAELLDRPVNQGVLSRHLHLGPMIGGPQDGEKPREQDKAWEWQPGNTDGMLDRTLVPFLRASRSPSLLALWDKRIASETARAKRTGLTERISHFNQQTLPRLSWQRASDLVLLGREAEGLTAMIGLLRQNSNHVDFDKFARELRDLLVAGEPAAQGASQN